MANDAGFEYGVSGDDGETVIYVGESAAAVRSFRELGGYECGARVFARDKSASGPLGAAPQPARSPWREVRVSIVKGQS